MTNIYRSFPAVINLVFTVSMILLAVRFWPGADAGIRILITAGILLFPVFQPLLIFLRCRRIVGRMPRDMEISIDKTGITTGSDGKSSHVPFRDIISVVRLFRMVIVQTRSRQGFILGDGVTGDAATEVYNFLKSGSASGKKRSGRK